jgi:hypothetical protein
MKIPCAVDPSGFARQGREDPEDLLPLPKKSAWNAGRLFYAALRDVDGK